MVGAGRQPQAWDRRMCCVLRQGGGLAKAAVVLPTTFRQERVMLQRFPLYAYIPAKDVARARQFYEGKLGLRPKQEQAGGVIYEFGDGTACFLYPTPNAGTSQAS